MSARLIRRQQMRQIVFEEAARAGVAVHEVLAVGRKGPVVEARHRAMKRMREEMGLSFDHIGRHFGRDHSTVISACRKLAVQARFATAPRGWKFAVLPS